VRLKNKRIYLGLSIAFAILISLFTLASVKAINIDDCAILNSSDTTYFLTQDLPNPTFNMDYQSACFVFYANNVTLDCQNHITDGTNCGGAEGSCFGAFAATALDYLGTNLVTIKNCKFVSLYNGIYLQGQYNFTIINDTLHNNWDGLYIESDGEQGISTNGSIINSTFSSNWEYGIDAFGLQNSTITGNMIVNNSNATPTLGGAGIALFEYPTFDVSNNHIYNNIFNNSGCTGCTPSGGDANVQIGDGYVWLNYWNSSTKGNYWGTPERTGFSDNCTNRGDGICDSAYEFPVYSGNRTQQVLEFTDYLPVTFNPTAPPPYINLIFYNYTGIGFGSVTGGTYDNPSAMNGYYKITVNSSCSGFINLTNITLSSGTNTMTNVTMNYAIDKGTYGNIAFNKTVTIIGLGSNANNAVDDNIITEAYAETQHNVENVTVIRIDLGRVYNLTNITWYLRVGHHDVVGTSAARIWASGDGTTYFNITPELTNTQNFGSTIYNGTTLLNNVGVRYINATVRGFADVGGSGAYYQLWLREIFAYEFWNDRQVIPLTITNLNDADYLRTWYYLSVPQSQTVGNYNGIQTITGGCS
jgi:parallel beta-helix repeat protein